MTTNMALLDESGRVLNVIVCDEYTPSHFDGVLYGQDNPAIVGGDYFEGFFYPPRPFASWVRKNGEWLPPTAYPTDGLLYQWDEASREWIADS